MIKFFRKIRQTLLSENKFSKYLLYAVGEIVLVVVGILLALQVNNWNIQKAETKLETKVLKEIKSNLESNLIKIREAKQYNTTTLEKYDLIFDYIEGRTAYNEELERSFGLLWHWAEIYLTRTAFESLKNYGINLIKNDSLRTRISELHEKNYRSLEDDLAVYEWTFHNNIKLQILQDLFIYNRNKKGYAKPIDYESLKTDVRFESMLNTLYAIRKSSLDFFDTGIRNINELLEMIEIELNK